MTLLRRFFVSGAWFDALIVGGATAGLLGAVWALHWIARWLEAKWVLSRAPAKSVRARPGYTIRFGADSVQISSRATFVALGLSVGVLLLGVVLIATVLGASAFPGWRAFSLFRPIARYGSWSFLGACGLLIPTGLYGLARCQRRAVLVLEARGPLRYTLDQWPLKTTAWELDPKAFRFLTVNNEGSVMLWGEESSGPRHVLNTFPESHLEEDIAFLSLFLKHFGEKDEPRRLGEDETQPSGRSGEEND